MPNLTPHSAKTHNKPLPWIIGDRWLGSLTLSLILAVGCVSARDRSYNPLDVSDQHKAETLDFTVHDEARNRDIPIRVYLPAARAPATVVLFSHGLGGSRLGYSYLGEHWSARGYVGVFLQHPGSDDSIWKDIPREQMRTQLVSAMQKALNPENALLRFKDVPALINELERWDQSGGHPLKGRLDLKSIGMSGHSFGAMTTQAVSGQTVKDGPFTDPRIKAAIAMSPSSLQTGEDPKQAFGSVIIPWLLMTGTKDVVTIGSFHSDVTARLTVFSALPLGRKYALVLDGAEHSAFASRSLSGRTENRNPNHHRAIQALTTAFWDAWLREDAAARAWLDGAGPSSVLDPKDSWKKK